MDWQIDTDLAGAVQTAIDIVKDGEIEWGDFEPTVQPCEPDLQQYLGRLSGNLGLYSVHLGPGGPATLKAEGEITLCDEIRVYSPIATTLELPVTISGSAFAAESFGDVDATEAKAEVSITGWVGTGGTQVHFDERALNVTSVTTIPARGSVQDVMIVPFDVVEGENRFQVHVSGRVSAEASAKSAGLWGVLTGAATVGVHPTDGVGFFSIGNFTGPGGDPLPPGTVIRSCNSDMVYWPVPYHDFNDDGVTDLGDVEILTQCLEGPDILPEPTCVLADLEGDDDVDLTDFAEFQRFYGE